MRKMDRLEPATTMGNKMRAKGDHQTVIAGSNYQIGEFASKRRNGGMYEPPNM